VLAPEPGIETRLYDADDHAELVLRLRAEARHAVIVGYSNTFPGLAAALCSCVVEPMNETGYNRLIVITILGKRVEIRTLDREVLFGPYRPATAEG